jgi:hypothetical protein
MMNAMATAMVAAMRVLVNQFFELAGGMAARAGVGAFTADDAGEAGDCDSTGEASTGSCGISVPASGVSSHNFSSVV